MLEGLAIRFWDKVLPEPNSGCWLWTGSLSCGYGQLGYKSGFSNKKAHRLSWEMHKGEIPEGMSVLHKCDVPSCCNPDHLFLGTQADNMADMDKKGRRGISNDRRLYGESCPASKLTESEAYQVKYSTERNTEIAKRFGISPRAVRFIKSGKNWKYLGENCD